MSLSFCGVRLAVLPDDYADWITTYHSLTDFRFSDLWHFEGFGLDHLPLPPMPHEDMPEVGVLYWPTGLSRCGFAHYLIDLEGLEDIRTALGTGAGPSNLILTDDISGDSVTVPMYFLCARPLSQIEDDDLQLYLMTLVDRRYFLRQRTGTVSSVSTWATLLSDLATALGITLTVDTIDADYSTPTSQWLFNEQYLSPVVDAVCNRLHHRVVADLDGTFQTVSVTTASGLQNPQVLALTKTAGGVLERADLRRPVPASVKVIFRSTAGGSYTVTKTLAGLAISEYGSATGVSGEMWPIWGEIIYDGTNATACGNYATQAATDYYLWCLTDTDITYPSVTEWTPTGCEDRVEWKYFNNRILTRVVRWPFQIPLVGTSYGSPLWGPVPGTTGITNSIPNYTVNGLLQPTPNYTFTGTLNGDPNNTFTVYTGTGYTGTTPNYTFQLNNDGDGSGNPNFVFTVSPAGTTWGPNYTFTVTPTNVNHLFTIDDGGNDPNFLFKVGTPSTGNVNVLFGNPAGTQGINTTFAIDADDDIDSVTQTVTVDGASTAFTSAFTLSGSVTQLAMTGTLVLTGATVTATTQSANDNSTKIATTAYVDAAVGGAGPTWTKVTKTAGDFSAAAATNDIEIYSLASKEVIHGVVVKHTAQFTGGGILAYNLSIGKSGQTTKYINSYAMGGAPSDTTFQANGGAGVANNPQPENFGASTSIRAYVSSSGANLDQATGGSVDIYILTDTLP